MPTPNSSSAIVSNCACCARGSAASSAISTARSPAGKRLRLRSSGRFLAPRRYGPEQRQRGYKLYSFHAPEVECIGKGKASALPVRRQGPDRHHQYPCPGGRFVLHAKALPGNPYDGHTLGEVIEATENLTGCPIERAYVDKGYRGHKTTNPRRVFISGQKRGVFGVIKRELRRRSAIEPVIGHMKTDGHLGRCYLKGREGDAANAVLTAVGHNLRLVLAWLRLLLRLTLLACARLAVPNALKWAS